MTVDVGKSKICRAGSRLSIQLKRFLEWLKGKESTCNAGNTGDTCSISGSGRSLVKEWQPTRVLAWDIPQKEEPGMLQYKWSQGVRHNLVTKQ